MLKKKEYVNMDTGEIVGSFRTWLGAWWYFKQDAKKYGYKIRCRDIKRYSNALYRQRRPSGDRRKTTTEPSVSIGAAAKQTESYKIMLTDL